jgi:hypothetical protein
MNWGWGGYQDGYFTVNNLAPGAGGTGSGSGTYNEGQDAVIGIEPDTTSAANRNPIVMNRNTFVNYASITRSFNFEITVAFSNVSSTDFNGDILVLLLDSTKNIVDTLASKTAQEIKAGLSTGDLKLSAKTNSVLTPGGYFIAYGTVKDGNWTEISDAGQYKNNVPLAIVKPQNDLSELGLNEAITLSTNQVRIGSPFTVRLDVTNYSTLGNTFDGDVIVDLLTTSGEKVVELGKKTGLKSLAVNAKIDSGVVATYTPTAAIKPGRYLIAAMATPNGSTGANEFLDWRGFRNPIAVDILPAELKDDVLEPNNTRQSASPLSLKSSKTDSIVIDDANLDDYQDVDYYKIEFPQGLRYAVTVSIEDLTNNEEMYSGIVSAYCDYMTKTAMYVDGEESEVVNETVTGTMYIEVEPMFVGQEGTYKLVVKYTELGPTAVNEDETLANSVRITKVPASSTLSVRMNDTPIDAVRILNVLGEVVVPSVHADTTREHRVDISSLPTGTYFVHISTGEGEVVKQFTVVK